MSTHPSTLNIQFKQQPARESNPAKPLPEHLWKAMSPEERLVVWAVRQFTGASDGAFDVKQFSPATWRRLLGLARWHRLLPILMHVFERHTPLGEAPAPVMRGLEDAHRWTLARNLVTRWHLSSVLATLADNAIPAVALKGIATMERLYPDLGLRPTGDIDLLVRAEDLAKAERVVRSLGFRGSVDERESARRYRRHHHLPPLEHYHSGAIVELHWQLVRPDRPYQVDIEGMWQRTQAIPFDGSQRLVLSTEDQLIHQCLHFLTDRLGSAPGALLQLCDMALLVRYSQVRWETFAEVVLRLGLTQAVYTTLLALETVTGVATPGRLMLRPHLGVFDERGADLFIIRRVIRGRVVRPDVVKALAASGAKGKLRQIGRVLSGTTLDIRGGEPWDRVLRRWRRLLSPGLYGKAFRVLLHQRTDVKEQVAVQKWLGAYLGMDGSSQHLRS